MVFSEALRIVELIDNKSFVSNHVWVQITVSFKGKLLE
jgi:hypothetical protein